MPTQESAGVRPQHPPATSVAALAAYLGLDPPSGPETLVTGVSLSSARVRPGDLYAALPGGRTHGAAYLADARTRGAVAVLTDLEGARVLRAAGCDLPALVVPAPREVLGRLSARIYGDPTTAMTMIGVTGTQGKTTTTRLAEGALQASGRRAGVVGTVGTRIDGHDVATSLTTPEAPDLQGLFARMLEQRVEVCALEVSSHALVMGRVDGVRFDCAVFLNLGRDHLDFHHDVEDYYRAKASLFVGERARRALVNLDDEHGRRLVAEVRAVAEVPVRTFSLRPDAGADWCVTDVELGTDRSRFTVVAPDGRAIPAGCPLPGAFNVANTLAAVAACAEAGLDPVPVAAAVAVGPGVPGRFERVDRGQPFTVVVDYAHKPDAVTAALETLRPLTRGRLVLVLGAGGDRDRGKRAIMGEIGGRLADLFLITDDNPRTEDPAAIRAEVARGARIGGVAEVVEVDERRAAITRALTEARAGDVVLVAGKGHEVGQEVAGVVHAFDDRAVVAEVLDALGAGHRSGPKPP